MISSKIVFKVLSVNIVLNKLFSLNMKLSGFLQFLMCFPSMNWCKWLWKYQLLQLDKSVGSVSWSLYAPLSHAILGDLKIQTFQNKFHTNKVHFPTAVLDSDFWQNLQMFKICSIMFFTKVLLYFHYCLDNLSTTYTLIYFTCVEVNSKII